MIDIGVFVLSLSFSLFLNLCVYESSGHADDLLKNWLMVGGQTKEEEKALLSADELTVFLVMTGAIRKTVRR